MRKYIIAMMLCISTLCFAQNAEHMKFMGTPMGITINQFQAQLAKKNVTVSPASKSLPVGQRVYNGKFSGKQAEILVWYNERSNLVYRCKAFIECKGKEYTISVLNDFENKLDLKYGTDDKIEGTFKDDYLHELRSVAYNTDCGRIDLFITGGGFMDTGDFYLHLDYHDLVTDIQNTMEELDDL